MHVFVACCASWLSAVLLFALRMPLRTLVGSGGKRSFAREEPICVCPMKTLRGAGCLGTKTQKRHYSGAFRSHDIIHGLSEP